MDHPVHERWRGGHAAIVAVVVADRRLKDGEGGWIGVSVDNNYYYTRRSFANAVLRAG